MFNRKILDYLIIACVAITAEYKPDARNPFHCEVFVYPPFISLCVCFGYLFKRPPPWLNFSFPDVVCNRKPIFECFCGVNVLFCASPFARDPLLLFRISHSIQFSIHFSRNFGAFFVIYFSFSLSFLVL